MRTAQIWIRATFWYDVEIYEYEYSIVPSPMLVYTFRIPRTEVKTLPCILRELGINDVCICEPFLPYYRKELIALRQVFYPEMPPRDLVQLKFW